MKSIGRLSIKWIPNVSNLTNLIGCWPLMGRGLGWMRLNDLINICIISDRLYYIGFGHLNLLLLRGRAGLISLWPRLRHIIIFTRPNRTLFGIKDLKYYLRLPCIWQELWGPRLFYIHRFVYIHFYIWLLRPWDICRLKLFIIIKVETLTFLLPVYETVEDVLVWVVEVLVDLVTGYRRVISGITGGSVEGDFSFLGFTFW